MSKPAKLIELLYYINIRAAEIEKLSKEKASLANLIRTSTGRDNLKSLYAEYGSVIYRLEYAKEHLKSAKAKYKRLGGT